MPAGVGGALLACLLLVSCSPDAAPEAPEVAEPPRSSAPTEPAPPLSVPAPAERRAGRVLAVGDIACPVGEEVTMTRCRHAEVAALAASRDPETVLLLGDLQYDDGSAADFAGSFDRSWGRLGDLLRPVPGNHEYDTEGAAGYADYVGERDLVDARGWGRSRVGDWSLYAVDSNCDEIDCGPQLAWLRDVLARDTGCSLMYLHHPRYSTGEHGPSPLATRFFALAYRAGVEMVLSGHDHHYERFVPMDDRARSRPDSGTVQYVSGGGGKSHYRATGDAPGSATVVDDEFGVLELSLRPGRWSSVFIGLDGDERDRYTAPCH